MWLGTKLGVAKNYILLECKNVSLTYFKCALVVANNCAYLLGESIEKKFFICTQTLKELNLISIKIIFFTVWPQES